MSTQQSLLRDAGPRGHDRSGVFAARRLVCPFCKGAMSGEETESGCEMGYRLRCTQCPTVIQFPRHFEYDGAGTDRMTE